MKAKESLFWSVALPGFGQLLNKRYVKGILFILLEILFNVKGHFNEVIISSFYGDIQKAIDQTNYGWLMFYPCLYFFSMWDAYKDAGGGKEPYSYLPFAFCAYFVTVSTIFSPTFTIFGKLFGPVWLGILSVIPGLVTGFLLKKLFTRLKM